MLGSVNSMILRLRSSALILSFGAFALAACASSEPATFDEQANPEEDSGTPDAKKPDAKSDADPDDGTGGAGGDGGAGGQGGGTGGSGGDPDTCGGVTCPEPSYPDFFKCCTSADKCGFKNGPSGFCYDAEEPDNGGGTGGGGP